MLNRNSFCALTFVTLILTTMPVGGAIAVGSHGGSHGNAEFGQPGDMSQVDRTIEVVMRDNYFEPESIEILRGETVRFVVKNEGAFVHEFNIGTPSMHAAHQEEMMMMVEHGVLEPDRINHDMMKMDMGGGHTMEHDDPNSVLLEPGQVGEIIWTFADSMELEFACNIPGHYNSGMAGLINFVTQLSAR